jgi:hypothetical protein
MTSKPKGGAYTTTATTAATTTTTTTTTTTNSTMTCEARIAANRRNALRSTGPRTPAGKERACRNAIRHGLASLTLQDPDTHAAVERLAAELAAGSCGRLGPDRARELAEAKVKMDRVRAAEMPLWETISRAISSGLNGSREASDGNTMDGSAVPAEMSTALAKLERLERYERRAASRWAKLLKEID